MTSEHDKPKRWQFGIKHLAYVTAASAVAITVWKHSPRGYWVERTDGTHGFVPEPFSDHVMPHVCVGAVVYCLLLITEGTINTLRGWIANNNERPQA